MYAQNGFVIDTILPENLCQIPQVAPHFNQLEQLRTASTPLVYARMKVHVIRKENSPQGGQTIEGVNVMMTNLYSIFDEEGIYFAWDGKINYINSDYYYNMTNQKADELINNYNNDSAIDLFLIDDTNSQIAYTQGVGVSTALVFGGYLIGAVNGKEGFTTMTRSGFVAHVMGHVLNLWDTHYGSPFMGGGGCPEYVNGNNGNTCGDYINDTPADPGLFIYPYGFNVDLNNCTYDPQYYPTNPPLDPNGQQYQPDTRNYMSFTPFSCMNSFTYGQSKIMKGAILFLDQFNNINLTETDYTYIRAVNDCYVCGTKEFIVYTTLDIANLTITSSTNVQTQVFPIDNTSFTVKVTSLVGNNEGSQGSFSIVNTAGSNLVIAKQNIWVGKPQTLPDGLLSGTGDDDIPINAGSSAYHFLGSLDYRFGGFEYINWEYPEPNEILLPGDPTSNTVWNYLEYNKFFMLEGSFSGDKTGWVRGYGSNPCGVGEYGLNEICVKNYGDGAPECDPEPIPIITYPNPADSLLSIDLSLQDYKVFNVVIYDANQVVRYNGQSTNILKTIDVANLPNDTYYLHIYDSGTLILSRILIINR